MKVKNFIGKYEQFSGVEEDFTYSYQDLYEVTGQLVSLNGLSKCIKGGGCFKISGGERVRAIPVSIIKEMFDALKDVWNEDNRRVSYIRDLDLLFPYILKNARKITYLSYCWDEGFFTNCGAFDIRFGRVYFRVYKKDCDDSLLNSLEELGYNTSKPSKTEGNKIEFVREKE